MARKMNGGKGSREGYWRGHVAARERGGESVREYCRARGLSESGFHFWKRELKRRDALRVARVAPKRGAGPKKAERVSFAEVRLTPSAAQEALIEIAVAGARRVQVHPGFDEETLARVLAVVERAGAPGAHSC